MTNSSLNQGQMLNNSSSNVVDIKRLTKILYYRRNLILGISCTVISVASLLAILAKPTYQSSMQILVSSKLYPEVDSSKVTEDLNVQAVDYTAQQKLMLSSQLIQQAVDLLRSNYPNITLEDIKGKKEHSEKSPLNVTQIKSATEINNLSDKIFEISFKDKDPAKAQKVLQALQTVYLNYNIEQQNERLNKGLAYVNARLPEVKKQVTQSEKKLEKFRKRYNLVDPEVQSKILLQSLADIQKQLQNTRAQLQDIKARQANLEQKIASSLREAAPTSDNGIFSSGVSQSTRYQTLLNEIQKTEILLTQQRLRYTENSPVIETLKQQRQSQLTLLRQEEGKLVGRKDTNTTNLPQMVGVDLKLVEEINQIQTTSLGLLANEKSLVDFEQRLRAELSKYPSLIAEYNRLLAEVKNNRQTLEQLLQTQQLLGIKIAQSGFNWQLLEAPEQAIYIGSGRLFLLGGGLIIGPILGMITALIWQIFHNVIYSPQELKRLTNLRLLGALPNIANRGFNKRIYQLFWHQQQETSPKLPEHENFDMVYQNIQLFNYPLALKSLMLTSTIAGEGKTTLALGLAASAAHMHRRVLVIDANLHHPSLHKILDLPNDWGLSLLLVDESNTPVAEYIQPIHPDIDVLTAGPTAEDTVKLFSSVRMKEIIELFEQTYDLVLIDAPAILDKVDARIIASLCNGIVLVGRIGQITQSEIIQAREIFSKLNLIGAIANDVKDAAKV